MHNMIWSGRVAILLLIIIGFYSCSEKPIVYPAVANYDIVPKPQKLDSVDGFFVLNNTVELIAEDKLLVNEKNRLNDFIKKSINVDLEKVKSRRRIYLKIDSTDLPDELYVLKVDKHTVNIISPSRKGISRGLSTLKQLILLNSNSTNAFIPCVKILDSPQFQHRGMLLDCSRHFFSKEVVKKYIDLLALYKMNTLHWHLTEDQGWRLAIDKYPRLTEIAAYRTELDSSTYGGFYTKKDIKEIVAYATERHINIIPEIELPGHSQAAISAYPHLSCTGNSIEVANDWGVFKDIYCAGNDSVFTFLEDVLTEVVELFPSPYIHIGGDEAPKVRWKQCRKCQKRITDEGLKDEHELQSYFIKRIQTFLKTKNKEIIGWDEILEGGLAEGAIVQSWRGVEGGIEAVKHGNKAIMSPTSHAYFDYGLKSIDLKKVYSFHPIPEGLTKEEAQLIIGGECNLWSEHIPTEANLDSKVFPRLLAMSEVLWSDTTGKDYDAFNKRVQSQYKILDRYNVKYGEEAVPMAYFLKPSEGGSYLTLKPYSEDIDLLYRFDCPTCDTNFLKYEQTLRIDKTATIEVQPNRNNKNYGEPIEVPFVYHSAINKKVDYKTEYSEWYTAGGNEGLVDSKLGTLDFRDGAWQGFWGKDVEVIIDLGELVYADGIAANFYQYNNSWIFLPTEVTYSISYDGSHFEELPKAETRSISSADKIITPKDRGKHIARFWQGFERQQIRYVKVKAKNIGKVPDWHEAAGSDAWLFIDEIIVW